MKHDIHNLLTDAAPAAGEPQEGGGAEELHEDEAFLRVEDEEAEGELELELELAEEGGGSELQDELGGGEGDVLGEDVLEGDELEEEELEEEELEEEELEEEGEAEASALDEEDEEADSDVEVSLDVILRERLVGDEAAEAEQEDEGAALAVPATAGEEVPRPRGADEFVCRSCFLVKPRTQLADPERSLCVDCAS